MATHAETLSGFGSFKAVYERSTLAPGETLSIECTVKPSSISADKTRLMLTAYDPDTGDRLFYASAVDNTPIVKGKAATITYAVSFTAEQCAAMTYDAIALEVEFAHATGSDLIPWRGHLTGMDLSVLKQRTAPRISAMFSDYIEDASAQYADDGTVLRRNVKAYFGDFVQGYSKLQLNVGVDVDITPWQYGELKLASAKLRFGVNTEVDVPIVDGSIDTFMYRLEYPIGEYGISGDIPFTLTVEDSMGYKSTLAGSVTILPYALPALSTFAVTRYVTGEDESGNPTYTEAVEGERVWIDAAGQVSAVAGKNAWTATVTRSSVDSSMAEDIASGGDGSSFSFTDDRGLFTGDVSNAVGHTFVLSLSDWITENFGISVQRTVFIPNADFVYTYNRYGFAVGMKTNASEVERRFEVGENHGAYFHGGIKKLGADWQELTLVNGTTPAAYGGGKLRCRRVENKCIIAGSVSIKPDGEGVPIAKLPEGFIPAYNVFSLNACTGGRVARVAVYSNEETNAQENAGHLCLNWVKNLSNGSDYTSEVWVQCSIEYWVEPEIIGTESTSALGKAILGQMVLGGV